jgi:hypothetical protein
MLLLFHPAAAVSPPLQPKGFGALALSMSQPTAATTAATAAATAAANSSSQPAGQSLFTHCLEAKMAQCWLSLAVQQQPS